MADKPLATFLREERAERLAIERQYESRKTTKVSVRIGSPAEAKAAALRLLLEALEAERPNLPGEGARTDDRR